MKMIPTTATNPANQQSATSAMFGIASLILEGRAISDDDFVVADHPPMSSSSSSAPTTTATTAASRPSTGVLCPTAIEFPQFAASSDQNFQQRLREKLGQLRQSSPSTSRDYFPLAEQKVTVAETTVPIANPPDPDEEDDLFAPRHTPSAGVQQPDTLMYTLQTLATTCLRTTPITFVRNRDGHDTMEYRPLSGGGGTMAIVYPAKRFSSSPHPTASSSNSSSSSNSPNAMMSSSGSNATTPRARPKVGPHCDQFLRKLGLSNGEAAEAEEHICDMSYVNKICYRWQVHCREMGLVTSRCESICIEVYLGPEKHSILLEQWIIQQKDKVPSPNMTLQSLCNAIRSQLYFSQITSWCDLIRKNGHEEFHSTGRMSTKRLDIYYKIKTYDATASFYAKPVVHNFPNVVISENCSLSVCLKSLPRIPGGIPHVGYNSLSPSQNASDELMPSSDGRHSADDDLKCECDDDDNSDAANLTHREKQLLKYKKRMLRRDKKSRKPCGEQPFANGRNTTKYGSSINSIRPPLYQIVSNSITESVQTNSVEMISTGTQTANFPMIYPSCDQCGCDMSFVCFNCDHVAHNQIVAEPQPPLNPAEMLLQAIQRTPIAKYKMAPTNNNDSSSNRSASSKTSGQTDCQLCKRQKTHHYRRKEAETEVNGNSSSTTNNNFRPCQGGSVKCPTTNGAQRGNTAIEINRTPSPSMVFDLASSSSPTAQFKTPTTARTTPNLKPPNLLQIATSSSSSSAITHRALPKVNLTQLFCNPLSTSSSPISISSSSAETPDVTNNAFTFDNIRTPEIPVQKSNSAPTLPNSPSLSPRFAKQAAIYKRRSRHLSDRSDRSSLGSDEQFSDEDFESMYSPATSPIKNRIFLRSSLFGRRPLLGNLEESLLQKRFVPKTQVAGFKVLLGASGGFCPTQKTIPAATYFYELSGQALSTPYVCEIRMPRKGYTIPRTGTVQATLLNPDGTVVRMFVIPYDFRDMPAMHQTFIRQRILAVDNSSETVVTSTNGNGLLVQNGCGGDYAMRGSNFGHLTSGEQMQLLRYSIHLRFQTSSSGRLSLHTDIRLLISRRTDCDTAAAHAKGVLESPNELRTQTLTPDCPKYSARQENPNKI